MECFFVGNQNPFEQIQSNGNVSYDSFYNWFSEQKSGAVYNKKLEKIGYVYFGIKPPSPGEESKIIEELRGKNVEKVGDSVYLISKKWLSEWEEYSSGEGKEPSAISNSELVQEDNLTLKADLHFNEQFLTLPSVAWKALSNWYGGGPSIERKLIPIYSDEKEEELKLEVEVYLVPVKVLIVKKKPDPKKVKNAETEFPHDEVDHSFPLSFFLKLFLYICRKWSWK